jgi:hypothetical protein
MLGRGRRVARYVDAPSNEKNTSRDTCSDIQETNRIRARFVLGVSLEGAYLWDHEAHCQLIRGMP